MVHEKCRCDPYTYRTEDGGVEQVDRFPVPEDKVDWNVGWSEYSPVEFTAQHIVTAVWADPELGAEDFSPKWNTLDGNVNRVSHEGEYRVDGNNRPLNIRGKTGITGRGVLGKWGPNHAADPIVTRWKHGEHGEALKDDTTGKYILEFVCIQRKDTGIWAIPGGMVDPGEKVSTTVKREFMEEALDTTGTAKENIGEIKLMVEKFFENGEEIYRGYVDDPRNTDNAWMETVALHFHDESGDQVGQFPLHAGDDAAAICWMPLSAEINLYASHRSFVETVVQKLGAHW